MCSCVCLCLCGFGCVLLEIAGDLFPMKPLRLWFNIGPNDAGRFPSTRYSFIEKH